MNPSRPADPADPTVLVDIAAGRAPVATLIGAVDAALASEIEGLRVRVGLSAGDERREALEVLCAADSRIEIGAGGEQPPSAGVVVSLPARARPAPRTLPAVVDAIAERGLGSLSVALPGRLGPRELTGGRLRASAAGGSGSARLRAGDVGLRTVASRGRTPASPPRDMAGERAEHLRHRARSSTMRARADRNSHRISRERLQLRHERARLFLAERRLGHSGAGEWIRWRARWIARAAGAVPARAAGALRTLASYLRRARRFAADRARRSPGPAS